MSPREEDNNQFLDDIGIGHIEVMLQRRHIHVSVDILLDVFLPCPYCALAHLETHLSCRVVDEASEGRMYV